MLQRKRGTGRGRYVLKLAVPQILVEQVALCVSQMRMVQPYVVDDVAIGDVYIEVTVIVVVEQPRSKSQGHESRVQAGLLRCVFKLQPAEIVIERVELFGEVRYEDVRKAIAVVIRDFRSHSGLRPSVAVESNTRAICNIEECAIALVMVEEVAYTIIGDINVRPSVVIDVSDSETKTL